MPPVFIPDDGKPIDFTTFLTDLPDEDGLAFVGANFHPQTLINAYLSGLFPWFIHQGYPHWYCPDPRMVLFPEQLKISKSMRNVFNQKKFSFSADTHFNEVMKYCASVPRLGESMSWIDDHFLAAYQNLYRLGFAHSFESWQDGHLVGGLYGVSIGSVFYGESMFSLQPNASKAVFIQAVRFLSFHGFKMIDCQVHTRHLNTLGAINISRHDFLNLLDQWNQYPSLNGINWEALFNQSLV